MYCLLRYIDECIEEGSPYELKIMKTSDFFFESCKARILQIQLPNMPSLTNSRDKYLFMSSIIEFEKIQLVMQF
jgi:hypothetical protein